MRYANVHTRFWIEPDIAGLGRDARELYLYLLTCPTGNMAGYFYLPTSYMLEHLQTADHRYPIDTVSIALQRLSEAGKVDYDPVAKVVLIRNHFAWNRPEGPKQVAGVLAAIREVPESRLLPEFVACAKKHVPAHEKAWDTLSIPYRYPIEPVSIAVSGTVSESVLPPTPSVRGKSKPDYAVEFEEWWTAYPHPPRDEKGRSLRNYTALRNKGTTHEQLLASARNYAATRRGEDPQYHKKAANFLGRDGAWTEWEASQPASRAPQTPPPEDEVTRMLREARRGKDSESRSETV